MAVEVLYKAPEIPGKFDIIPIHSSDRDNFKRCRRYWDWNSPSRTNLTVRADVMGVNIPMFFGTGIHYALEQFYQPGLNRDPVESFKTWFDVQWRGGMVGINWLDKVYDLKPRNAEIGSWDSNKNLATTENPLYIVRGLQDILPDPNHEEFDELFTLGIEMMRFYKDYAEKHDDFVVLLAEHTFSVPIWDYENDCILKRIDLRHDSPNYGKELEVHARGRQDGITMRHESERLGIIDHKTAAKVEEENLLRKLETDEQCTNYLAVAQVEANYYDLPHKGIPFEEVIYNTIRKAYPKPPTELKNGMFSINRQEESTTYEMLMAWIAKNMPGVPLNEKQKEYIIYLHNVGDEQFVLRKPVRRTQKVLQSALERMYLEALDMLDPNIRIYPNLTNDWLCFNCQFRIPCLAKEDGSDYEDILHQNYSTAKDR